FAKLREGATTFVSWENSPKKEGVFPKREIDTDRLQKITVQSLLLYYKRLQKSDIDYKFSHIDYKVGHRLQKVVVSTYFITKVCSVRFLTLQKCGVCFSDI
ncbi:hypothetical protein K443DRAFT_108094, partial [Laccaria amethystina LaAM-08-1]